MLAAMFATPPGLRVYDDSFVVSCARSLGLHLDTAAAMQTVRAALSRRSPPTEGAPFGDGELKRWRAVRGWQVDPVRPRLGFAKAACRLLQFPDAIASDVAAFIDSCADEKLWREVWSTVSNTVKRIGSRMGAFWRNCVNCDLLLGFWGEADPMSEYRDVKAWVGVHKVHSWEGSEEAFMQAFESGVDAFLAKGHFKVFDESVSAWSSDPGNWGTSGSTRSKANVTVTDDDGTHGVRRSKWTAALTYSADEVEHMILKDAGWQKPRVIQKQEAGKVRYVVSSDDVLYLRMAYVSSWLERGLSGHPNCSLFWTSEQLDNWREARIAQASAASHWFLPIDQSHFDWNVNYPMIDAVLAKISALVDTHATIPDPGIVMSLIRRTATKNVRVPTSVADVVGRSGLLSGWRWTALIGSIVNFATCYALAALSGVTDMPEFVVQGDDVSSRWSSGVDALTWFSSWQKAGFEVNPAKTFLARDRDEYLRVVTTAEGANGYAARVLPSLMYRKPWLSEPPKGDSRAHETVKNWCLFYSRSCEWSSRRIPEPIGTADAESSWFSESRPIHPSPKDIRVWEVMVRDVEGLTGWSRAAVHSWLSTDATLGAGGLGTLASGLTTYWLSTPGRPRVDYVLRGTASVRGRYDALVGSTTAASIVGSAAANVVYAKPREQRRRHVVAHPADFTFLETDITSPPPAMPVWNDLVPRFGRGEFLSEIFGRANGVETSVLLDRYCAAPASAIYLRNKLGKHLWVDWISGGKPFSGAYAPFVSQSAVSRAYTNCMWSAIRRTRTKRIDSLVLTSLSLACSRFVRSWAWATIRQ